MKTINIFFLCLFYSFVCGSHSFIDNVSKHILNYTIPQEFVFYRAKILSNNQKFITIGNNNNSYKFILFGNDNEVLKMLNSEHYLTVNVTIDCNYFFITKGKWEENPYEIIVLDTFGNELYSKNTKGEYPYPCHVGSKEFYTAYYDVNHIRNNKVSVFETKSGKFKASIQGYMNAFLPIGVDNKYILAVNNTVMMKQYNNSKNLWKIDNIGGEVFGKINSLTPNLVQVRYPIGFVIIDIRQGRIVLRMENQKGILKNMVHSGLQYKSGGYLTVSRGDNSGKVHFFQIDLKKLENKNNSVDAVYEVFPIGITDKRKLSNLQAPTVKNNTLILKPIKWTKVEHWFYIFRIK